MRPTTKTPPDAEQKGSACLRRSSQSLVHSRSTRATSRRISTVSGRMLAPQLWHGTARWCLAHARPVAVVCPHLGQLILIPTA